MEEKELSRNNKIKIIVVTLLIFLVAIAGISYAYFSIQITGNDTASSIRVTTANLRLIYTDTLVMSGDRISPGWTQTKTITVENAGNQPVYYNIIWRDLYNEITNNELVISATCTSDVSGNSCSGIDETVIPTVTPEAHNIAIKSNIEIQVGETHTYTVTVLFKETYSNQNYNQNKEFYGTLNIDQGVEPATLSLKTDQGTIGTLDRGDEITLTAKKVLSTGQEVTVSGEDFYVVSSDATNTVLLAKYNLYVGRIYDSSTETYTEILPTDDGYGLQSEDAKGQATDPAIGVVPFSSSASFSGGYWYDDTNGTLKSKYGNSFETSNIYDKNYIAPPNWNLAFDNNTENAYYSIAYYVEEYVSRLGIRGTGRLLTYEEANNLDSSQRTNGAWYWLGSAYSNGRLYVINSSGSISNKTIFSSLFRCGVRPVIVVPTSDIGE